MDSSFTQHMINKLSFLKKKKYNFHIHYMYMLEDLQRYLRYYDSNVTRFRNKLSIFCISVSNLAFHHFKNIIWKLLLTSLHSLCIMYLCFMLLSHPTFCFNLTSPFLVLCDLIQLCLSPQLSLPFQIACLCIYSLYLLSSLSVFLDLRF